MTTSNEQYLLVNNLENHWNSNEYSIPQQLSMLSNLKENWDGNNSSCVDSEILKFVEKVFSQLVFINTPFFNAVDDGRIDVHIPKQNIKYESNYLNCVLCTFSDDCFVIYNKDESNFYNYPDENPVGFVVDIIKKNVFE